MYLWVQKIQRVELRHYGKRLMVEFHIPEPAVSLLERSNRRNVRKRLPPFDVSPSEIQMGNYLCLAQRYAAFDVEPPPAQYASVGYGWVSTENEDDVRAAPPFERELRDYERKRARERSREQGLTVA